MSADRERLKSKNMAQVKVLVEQALAQGENRLTLTQIEDVALAARSEMSRELTSGLLEQQASGLGSELALPAASGCSRKARNSATCALAAVMWGCTIPTSTVSTVAEDISPWMNSWNWNTTA